MKQDHGSLQDGTVRAILATFIMRARTSGQKEAQREATAHLLAATAYLDETAGHEKTTKILRATIASMGSGSTEKH
jgi:butyrate kinase